MYVGCLPVPNRRTGTSWKKGARESGCSTHLPSSTIRWRPGGPETPTGNLSPRHTILSRSALSDVSIPAPVKPLLSFFKRSTARNGTGTSWRKPPWNGFFLTCWTFHRPIWSLEFSLFGWKELPPLPTTSQKFARSTWGKCGQDSTHWKRGLPQSQARTRAPKNQEAYLPLWSRACSAFTRRTQTYPRVRIKGSFDER